MNSLSEHIGNLSLFAGLSEKQREQIAGACRRRVYRERVHLFHEGDMGGQLYIVLRGGVRIYTTSESTGQETTLTLLAAGDFFGEMALLTGGERTASAMTIAEETELLLLDSASFMGLLRDSFDLTTHILKHLVERLKQTNTNLATIASNTSMARVAKVLLARADPHSGMLCPPMSQEDLANLVGVRRETVARNLARMEEGGCLMRNRGQITITSRPRLERMAETG